MRPIRAALCLLRGQPYEVVATWTYDPTHGDGPSRAQQQRVRVARAYQATTIEPLDPFPDAGQFNRLHVPRKPRRRVLARIRPRDDSRA